MCAAHHAIATFDRLFHQLASATPTLSTTSANEDVDQFKCAIAEFGGIEGVTLNSHESHKYDAVTNRLAHYQ